MEQRLRSTLASGMNGFRETLMGKLLLLVLLLFQRQGQACYLRNCVVTVGYVAVSRGDECFLLSCCMLSDSFGLRQPVMLWYQRRLSMPPWTCQSGLMPCWPAYMLTVWSKLLTRLAKLHPRSC